MHDESRVRGMFVANQTEAFKEKEVMSTELIEICDRCKSRFSNGVKDINHLRLSNLTRFVVVGNPDVQLQHGFSLDTEICAACKLQWLDQLKQLFNHTEGR